MYQYIVVSCILHCYTLIKCDNAMKFFIWFDLMYDPLEEVCVEGGGAELAYEKNTCLLIDLAPTFKKIKDGSSCKHLDWTPFNAVKMNNLSYLYKEIIIPALGHILVVLQTLGYY